MITHKHEYHPYETKEQFYDEQLHDVAWRMTDMVAYMRGGTGCFF